MITSHIDDHGKVNSKHTQLSISAALITIPASALFIGYEYLGYKKGIADYAEEVSAKYEKLIENMKEMYPERSQILEEYLEQRSLNLLIS